jgi:histidinol-phosphate aminotransferase
MVPYLADFEDIEQLLFIAGKHEASLIYLANPDNPMGTFHAPKKIEKLISQLPQNSVLCLDEAYGDFLPDGCSPNIAVDNPQVIRLRTFSKAYGMAGARIGYGIGEVSFIKAFDKIRNHFGVSRMSQAGAMASLEDDVHLNMVKKSVENAKVRIKSIADKNGLLTVPSATNFVAVDCRKDGNYAKSVLQELERQGIFVRMPSVAPLNRCIRISVGSKTGLDKLETAMPIALQISK